MNTIGKRAKLDLSLRNESKQMAGEQFGDNNYNCDFQVGKVNQKIRF